MVDEFHRASSNHRPLTQVRMLHDTQSLYIDIQVQDQYVRAVHQTYQSMVSRDSCAEVFLQPPGSAGYFNFELNCCGIMLLYYIEDPARHALRIFRKATPVPDSLAKLMKIRSLLTGPIEPEIAEPTPWRLGIEVPLAVFKAFVPSMTRLSGDWRGNFFKCGDETSHPHWASWNPIGSRLRFHQPRRFAPIRFE